jgi:hypothetical protein
VGHDHAEIEGILTFHGGQSEGGGAGAAVGAEVSLGQPAPQPAALQAQPQLQTQPPGRRKRPSRCRYLPCSQCCCCLSCCSGSGCLGCSSSGERGKGLCSMQALLLPLLLLAALFALGKVLGVK